MGELWQAFVQVTAAANALLLGAVIIFSRRLHRTRSRYKLGFAVLCYGCLLLSFTARDNLWLPLHGWLLLTDYVLVLLASALFLDYMNDALRRRDLSKACYLPLPLFLAVCVLLGDDFILGSAINWLVLLQFAYTVLTTWVFVRCSRGLASWPRHLVALLAGLWVLHLFQFSRMLLPDVGWLFDMVPLAGAFIFLALTVLMLTDPLALRSPAQAGIAIPSAPDAANAADAISQYMTAERPFLDPHLSLARLAAAVGLAPRELSSVIASSPHGSFYHFVNRFRVDEAKRLLTDPEESRTSVEAIGLLSGFRSRSTFYEAFKRETGVTPAQFRAQYSGSDKVSG